MCCSQGRGQNSSAFSNALLTDLHQYCHNVATSYPLSEMRKFVVLNLEQLGPNGMSSNESNHEVGNRELIYFILTKPWRDKSVTAWLCVLDILHLCERYRWEFTATPRSWPHFQYSSY